MGGTHSLPETITPYPVVANIDFAEGPIFDDAGNLYFVNYLESGTLGKMAADGTVEVWVHNGTRINGLKYDGDDHVVAADYGGKRVSRFETRTRRRDILTDSFDGQPYLGVNDVCLDLAGNVYFTDPGANESGSEGGLYRIAMDRRNQPSGVSRLDNDLPYPNGLAVHPDQKRLFVALSGLNSVVSYDLGPDGTVSNQTMVHQFDGPTVDGMMFDEFNRLWVARWLHGTVAVVDVETGELLADYPMGGDRVTNMCWWEESLYVTVAGRHSIERLDVGCRGAQIVPARESVDEG